QNLDLYAFHGTTLEYALQRNGFAMLLLLLLLDGGLCITGMVIVSNLFTRRLSKRITVPLDALHNAAARVTNGDMTQPISYQGEAEFEQVCTAFNGMQTEILEANARRDAYERARIDMVAGVSHDLRTPLTAIQGAIKGVQDGIAATPEAQAEFLAIAYRRSQDMNKMLERLLYVSRLETGVIPLHLERTEWRGFLADYAAQAAPTRGKLTLDASSDDATLCSLIDPDQMRRILDNLIENSVKYAQADDLTLRLRLCAKGDQVQVDFSDNGVGVSSEQLPRIFEQFYRADESRTREKGNGLGLFIVSRLVEAMGGSVRAENSNGLWIRMTFPKAEGDEADAE
ncbi:MAG: HAMP domain-containing sensor histidine kinase, partial [Eubacteriales bacterium]|nr:HAMP domain-containing sensor histidine kinase [Eubacteriales bacterium]